MYGMKINVIISQNLNTNNKFNLETATSPSARVLCAGVDGCIE